MVNVTVEYNPVAYWTQRGYRFTHDTDPLGVLGQNMADWIKAYSKPGDIYLEVGSGYGRVYSFFEQRSLVNTVSYAMCDISPSMAEICTNRTGIEVDLWDGIDLPYPDRCFDWVISANVMLHVPPDDIDAFVEEHKRVSRKWLMVSTYIGPGEGLSAHCFKHDYPELWAEHELAVEEFALFEKEQQGQWLLTV